MKIIIGEQRKYNILMSAKAAQSSQFCDNNENKIFP